MDLYLPADYLQLRQALPDWGDADARDDLPLPAAAPEPVAPDWQAI